MNKDGEIADEYEGHEPAISPSLLFTEQEVEQVNWEQVFKEW